MTPDSCRPVEVTVDGQAETIRVHGVPESWTEQDREAMGALIAAARAKMAAEHPHAGVIQELMLAWLRVRCCLPPEDSRAGRNRDVAAVKQRMSDAITAVREALERAS